MHQSPQCAETLLHWTKRENLPRFSAAPIMLTILSLNLLGDGLRDALDPKLKN